MSLKGTSQGDFVVMIMDIGMQDPSCVALLRRLGSLIEIQFGGPCFWRRAWIE